MNNPIDAAIEAINAQPQTDDRSALVSAKCRALLRGYHARWGASNHEVQVLEVEEIAMAPMTNPATLRKSKSLYTAGKLDLVIQRDGKRVLWDHKTTSDDIADPCGTYWRQLVVESQPSHYMWLKWLLGDKLDEACWDVIRKPGISPRLFKSKAEKAAAVASRRWFDGHLSDESMHWLQENDRENIEMYEYRLTSEVLVNYDRYYQRKTIPRLDSEVMDYASELWDSGQLLLGSRKHNRWPKHPSSCMNYGRPCPYLGICSGFDNAESANWTTRAQAHGELTPEQDRNTLTFSSVRCYQSCPKKFFYRYELGIERIDEEEVEPLYFGSLLHKGLENYWRALMPEANEHEVIETQMKTVCPF